MKKLAAAVMFLAVVSVASAALAWDIKVPTNADGVKDIATSAALQNALNEKLKNANCTFVPGTTKVKDCDLKKIGTELGAISKVSAQKNYRIYISIAAADAKATGKKAKATGLPTGYDRATYARDEMKKGGGVLVDSWSWDTNSDQGLGDKLSLSVKVEK